MLFFYLHGPQVSTWNWVGPLIADSSFSIETPLFFPYDDPTSSAIPRSGSSTPKGALIFLWIPFYD
jgi:hypothetical protein